MRFSEFMMPGSILSRALMFPKSARKRGTFKKSPRLLLVGVGFLPQGSGLFDFSTRRCDFFAFAEDKDRGFWKNRGMRARRCLRWPVQKR